MKKIISVEGMACEHCVAAVKSALEKLDGIKAANLRIFYLNLLSLNAFKTTVTELKLIHAAAIIGFSVQPNIP